ncbi:hypothetical protein [Candidatus Stoquefichus sp. SB1]|uniref:hypothetical protein n=1 Tax=Candidatus Stoquefichus sp. SB1 TaxID=1658109 RepID=UPI00067E93BC|nr:hypothetical protein [Candidatus Stoquefichus sp. SB1]
MKETFLKVVCWVLLALFCFYIYWFVIVKTEMFLFQTQIDSIDELRTFILAGVLDLTMIIVIYGEKIRRDLKTK